MLSESTISAETDKQPPEGRLIYTVGHSNQALAEFTNLLRNEQITAIADVRSQPYSRHNPQFNRETLRAALSQVGISYVFLGKELGARSDDPSCYTNGRVRYELLGKTLLFRSGIERVLKGANEYRIALMCAEKDPLDCHRTLLVSRELVRRGAGIEHILSDGRTERHEDALMRLLDLVGLPRSDMFRSFDQLINEAYRLREEKVAYVDLQSADNPGEI